MPQDRTRKIAVAGILSAISILLGITRWGFIPWFGGVSITIMHVPVIIGAILEGPIVGLVIGLIFGVFSLLQAAMAPTGPIDVFFTNPLVSVLPRILIGPAAWGVYTLLKRWQIPALVAAGGLGSLTNTGFVLGMLGVLEAVPWSVIPPVVVANGIPEIIASVVLVLAVILPYKNIVSKKKQGASLD